MDCVIVRYSELGLKGKNRSFFENKLVDNIIECLQKNKITYTEVLKKRGRIIVYTSEDATRYLKDVFGISSLSMCYETDLEIDKIKKVMLDKSRDKKFDSFRLNQNNLFFITFSTNGLYSYKNNNKIISFKKVFGDVSLHSFVFNLDFQEIKMFFIGKCILFQIYF